MKKISDHVGNRATKTAYDHNKIEKKWQKKWASSKIYKSKESGSKYYILDMFPYPSGEGLHVGHPKGYIATDIVSRMKRMQGHSVLHPMGFDAFGLPAENYALKTKTNPDVSVKKNVAHFKDQLQLLGLDYDWSREINTTDPEYYRWTQWIFLQMFKKGLAYESFEPINWCPSCKTGLANEDVEDGRCERCGTLVEKKPMRQWVLKITDYAQRLLADLDTYDTKSLPHIIDKKNPPKLGKKSVERRTIHALVRDPKTGKFLGLKWHKHPWITFIVGGVDVGEDIVEAARREVAEETGYTDIKFVQVLGGPVCAEYYAAHKDQNRVAVTSGILFELVSDKKVETSKETHEDFENVWLDLEKDMTEEKMTCAELPVWLERLPTSTMEYIGSVPCFTQVWEPGTVREDKPFVERDAIVAIVKHWKEDKYIGLKWKKVAWQTLITGGIEKDQTAEQAAIAEILEETGYMHPKLVKKLGRVDAKFFHVPKDQNRWAHFEAMYFELQDGERREITAEEKANHEVVWVNREDVATFIGPRSQKYTWTTMMWGKKAEFSNETKPLLDWPASIVKSQKDWIGRSEGALINFALTNNFANISSKKIEVFTTRPDTLFGVTYVVLSPEHKLVAEFLDQKGLLGNRAEVEAYISRSKNKTEIERTDATKEKTGVELKGVAVINPANGEKVPVWISDYVLADYGTGAVMAVPAHDERDFAFAKKFKLEIKQVIAPYFENTTDLIPRSDKPVVRRSIVHAIIKHHKENKFLFIKWKDHAWNSMVTGGIETGEDVVTAARREVLEETGYKNLKHIKTSGEKNEVHSFFYATHKDENRYMMARGVMFQLENEERAEMSQEEKSKHDIIWLGEAEAREFLTHENQKVVWDYCMKGIAWCGSGRLVNSDKFNDRSSDSIAKDITSFVGGKWVTKYKLRDWVFSRQRYWGEPIPVVHCEKCGVVPIPEKSLPVKLPKVKSYEPTGTGESPLAAIEKWVNVKCPQCGGKAKRETNTMPQWAGSSWYYLRYMDPKNSRALVDIKKEKYWSPVDFYVGGAEHATRHLIYARFWHKFLYDIGVVSNIEPFLKLQHVGLIMGEDGRKMSKRFGNVVNPDDVVKIYGADTLRIYEMFMGPFDQQISWNTDSMIGARRFIERVWKLANILTVGNKEAKNKEAAEKIVHKTIKKVSDDISTIRFNTAISSLMIAVNELEKTGLNKEQFEILLKLLAPFAPHMTEELWMSIGNKGSIHTTSWPEYKPELAVEKSVTIAVQVNGKVRGTFEIAADSSDEALKAGALALPEIQKWLAGKEAKKIIVIKGKLVSIVI